MNEQYKPVLKASAVPAKGSLIQTQIGA